MREHTPVVVIKNWPIGHLVQVLVDPEQAKQFGLQLKQVPPIRTSPSVEQRLHSPAS